MTIYFCAKNIAFYDDEIHGARTIQVPDPNWVRQKIQTTLKPGDFAIGEHGVIVNDSDEEMLVEAFDHFAQAPLIEVPNPVCMLPPAEDLVEIAKEQHQFMIAGQSAGKIIAADEAGYPILIEPPAPKLEAVKAALLLSIDRSADAAYSAIAGNRTAEYQMTEADSLAFKAAGYKGDVPLSVQSYVDSSNLTPKQATDGILAQAAGMRSLVAQIREARLVGKSKVKAATEAEAAQAAADAARQDINDLLNPKETGK